MILTLEVYPQDFLVVHDEMGSSLAIKVGNFVVKRNDTFHVSEHDGSKTKS